MMKTIPYSRQCLDNNDINCVMDVLRSDWLTQGPKVKEFENMLCKKVDAKYAVAVSSGTAALHIACLAAGIAEADRVITSPITFVASANCILYCKGIPVFADIQKDTVNIDPIEIKKKITKKTKAIIPIHFAGHPCDLEEIHNIARKYNLVVIEDAAHALGAKYRDSKIGSCKYSDMTVFSFHPVKHITTGEGGAVVTNKKYLFEKLLMFRSHGITKERVKLNRWDGPWYYEQQLLGFNYRITDIQCALGISQLEKFDLFLKRRKEISNFYNRELYGSDKILLPVERPYVNSSWHLYYIRFKDSRLRNKVFRKLHSLGINTQVHYIPIHLQPYYKKHFGYKSGDYVKAELYYNQTLSIPFFPAMKFKEAKRVTETLKELLSNN